MFGLISRREHEDALLDLESENVCARQQNEGLIKRIKLGEDYRSRLELENASLRDANRRLIYERDELTAELARKENQIRELQLIKESMEAMWGRGRSDEIENAGADI